MSKSTMVKGYAKYFQKKELLTWEYETDAKLHNVRKVYYKNGEWEKDRRLYDKTVLKKDVTIL